MGWVTGFPAAEVIQELLLTLHKQAFQLKGAYFRKILEKLQ